MEVTDSMRLLHYILLYGQHFGTGYWSDVSPNAVPTTKYGSELEHCVKRVAEQKKFDDRTNRTGSAAQEEGN